MSQSTASGSAEEGGAGTSPAVPSGASPLLSERGKTTITDSVVAKITGIAAREVAGIHAMGTGAARALGALREKLPGSSGPTRVTQGVSVEVGERQAAADVDIVVEYGVPIVDVANAVRDNVSSRIERLTGLEVVEVNVSVNDVHIEGDAEDDEPQRVQ